MHINYLMCLVFTNPQGQLHSLIIVIIQQGEKEWMNL